MQKKIPILLLLLAPVFAKGQFGRDTVLLNERSMDRPVILHDRQLRITGGYAFATLTSRFNDSGDKIRLSSEGRSSILHHAYADFRYGLLDMFQVTVLLNYVSNIRKEQPVYIFPSPEPPIQVLEFNHYTGLEDIFAGIDFLLPDGDKQMDVVFGAGMTLPTAETKTAMPGHTFENFGSYQVITYNNNYSRGQGVITAYLSSQFKYRFKNLALSTYVRYGFPTAEAEDVFWSYRLDNGDFRYQSRSFSKAPSRSYLTLIEVEYQLFPFIDLFVDLEQAGSYGGWSDLTGQKVAYPAERLSFVNPGVEILLTPKFWLRQRAAFALEGKNTLQPFSVQTSLIYNFFPF